jgi:hypothetical protein
VTASQLVVIDDHREQERLSIATSRRDATPRALRLFL